MDRYSPDDVVVIMHHLHITTPDPMTNKSTEARAKFYRSDGTPSCAIDGKLASGGGSRDEAKTYHDKLNTQIEKDLNKSAGARILLTAFRDGHVIKVKLTVDNVTSESSDLQLQIALVEDRLTYSGENGTRLHPMVARSLAGKDSEGFAIDRLKTTNGEYTFNVEDMAKELKGLLDDFEKERKITSKPYQKKDKIDENHLSVAAFVQDTKSKQVLQAAFAKVRPED
jgi:hypothetical protein